jgi:hypothetical protein
LRARSASERHVLQAMPPEQQKQLALALRPDPEPA